MNKTVEEHLENLKEFYKASDIKDYVYLKKLIVRNINDVLNRYRKYDKVSMGKLIQEVLDQQHRIDRAISFIYLLKNNVKDYDTEYKEDFLNMLDDIGNILGDKENE